MTADQAGAAMLTSASPSPETSQTRLQPAVGPVPPVSGRPEPVDPDTAPRATVGRVGRVG